MLAMGKLKIFAIIYSFLAKVFNKKYNGNSYTKFTSNGKCNIIRADYLNFSKRKSWTIIKKSDTDRHNKVKTHDVYSSVWHSALQLVPISPKISATIIKKVTNNL